MRPPPLAEALFPRLGMALIGPFERYDRGYRSVLVLVDHAARYPNAVLLRSAAFLCCVRKHTHVTVRDIENRDHG